MTCHAEDDDIEAVLQANQAYYAAFTDLDVSRMSDVWWHGIDVTNINPRTLEIVRGWEQVHAHWTRTMAGIAQMEVSMLEPIVVVHGETARVVGRTRFERRIKGHKLEKGAALATNVFEKHEGRWYLVHHHATQIPQDKN